MLGNSTVAANPLSLNPTSRIVIAVLMTFPLWLHLRCLRSKYNLVQVCSAGESLETE